VEIVAGVRGGHGVPSGTPAISRPSVVTLSLSKGARDMVAGVRGGHNVPSGTPAISRPWEIATRTKFALGILPPRISVTPRRDTVPAPNAWHDFGVSGFAR